MFMDLLKKIDLKDTDTLYVLGDVLDRGPHPIKTLLKLMEMPNAICLVGNHELMALECLKETTGGLLNWMQNGSDTTIKEFRELDREDQEEVIEFIREFSIYEEITVGDKNYLLVHSGLGNFKPEKEIEDYSLKELVWDRAEYDREYYPDKYVITGHTPTQLIEENPNPGYIYRNHNHIAIDCGSCFEGGRLAAICLDTGEEFYSEA